MKKENQSEEIKKESMEMFSLHEKKLMIMGKLKSFYKDGNNSAQKFKYVSESNVAEIFRPLFVEHEISLTVEVDDIKQIIEPQTGKSMSRVIIKLKITLQSGTEKEHYSWFSEGADSADKGINKAVTAGLKYFLLRNFLSDASDTDPDADKLPEELPPAPEQTPTDKLNESLKNCKTKEELEAVKSKWANSLKQGRIHIDDYNSGIKKINEKEDTFK